ncbi:cache domain-containing sensor histidine kinase [Paenibacillus planticolens]|uniref:HAMP domain-containing protein n=1 Tax=Paenibacillus planticolens TaxID=2654976 RepID=A0ABX1ZWK1_9BACL|nr:sensor histidine kinase [Paenibacillus planticolens]NOV04352.1 HAMP domain-containing protein [Paenibacillus planticolens]
MTFFHTLRFKLIGIYLLTIVTPFIILAFISPYFAQSLITKETEKLTGGIVNSLSRNIETYLDDLERLTSSPYLNDNVLQALKLKASNRYESADAYTRLQTDRALTSTLPNFLINTRNDILSTITITNNDVFLTTRLNLSGLVPNFPFTEQDWYNKAIEADGKAAFISSHPQNYISNSKASEVFSVARLIKDPDSRQPLAVILADADTRVLEKITNDTSFNVSSIIVILDENKRIIYANNFVPDDVKHELENSRDLNSINTPNYVTVSNKLSTSNWNVVVLLTRAEVKSKVRWIYNIAVLLSIGGLFVTFFVFHYFSRWIVTPFKRMIEIMREVKKGNLQARFTVVSKDEIGQLGDSFNKMINQLDDLINREYKAVLAQRNAEYHALQSQIQPHFLYNTLNGIIGLNRAGETKKLESSVLSLSGMLRYILEGKQMASFKEEFEFLQKYAMLQQLRFEERLFMKFELDDSVASFHIPKLLLQPIVENAIIHGVEPCDKPCEVSVSANTIQVDENYFIHVEIKDNGVGFQTKSSHSKQHIGISNVRSRLLMSNEKAEMTVTSSPGSGTTVVIRIPLKEKRV